VKERQLRVVAPWPRMAKDGYLHRHILQTIRDLVAR